MGFNMARAILNSGQARRPSGGQSGSVILTTAVLIAVLASFITYGTTLFVTQRKAQSHIRDISESASLATFVQMIYSTTAACHNNLTHLGFGTTLAELKANSAAHQITLITPPDARNPSSTGPNLVTKDQRRGHELILGVDFTDIGAPHIPSSAGKDVYLAYLNIRSASDGSSIPRVATVPFYLVATGGVLSSCFATGIPGPPPAGPGILPGFLYTLEDTLCFQIQTTEGFNSSLFFDPSSNSCRY